MSTWGEIINHVNRGLKTDPLTLDNTQNNYLKLLNDFTKRDTIIYASKWATGDVPPHLTSINDEDVHGFMEALAGLSGDKLDLILHTGGGSAEATEAIVSFLRLKYNDIRVIVPQAAMSAGTMFACAADKIVMGKQSSLGPIDPQFILQTSVGTQSIPAHAILEQFKKAQDECSSDPKKLNSWLPMLSQYGPALLVRCSDQIEFGKNLVKTWLTEYMFKDDPESNLPELISSYLSEHSNFKTHGKHININEAKKLGLKITDLESDQQFQDKLLSVFHSIIISFNISNTTKIIANHKGNRFIKMVNTIVQHKK